MAFSFDLAVIIQRERRRKVIRRRRREEICKNHHEATREEIPFDLAIEILTRLPPKSLMRFKSVSELWSSLIRSQYFTNRFLKASSSPPRLYMWLGFENSEVFLSSSASHSPASDGTTMASFVVDQDWKISAVEDYTASHVYRGLMCFTSGPSAKIYNITTRQLVVLPDIEGSNIIPRDPEMIMYQIGHDPVHDRYKVVCTVSRRGDRAGGFLTFLSESWILPLGGGDGSSRWRKIPSRCPPHLPTTQGLTINGRVHYLAWGKVPYQVLVTIDIHSEEISILEVPHFIPFFNKTGLIEHGGRVALLHHWDLKDKCEMELWVMEDEEKNTWSKKTLVLHPSQMHMVCTTTNGEVIFVPDKRTFSSGAGKHMFKPQKTTSFYVFLYNLQKNHMTKVDIIESSNRCHTQTWDVIGFDDTENLMYL
ncbi:unnamed protein product [Thlaspi arvense]|uniref:F-box domain-containing protein n=1 Tax=Thlaspi arvense TaxID=13288 RepID=A0AAU9T7R3_THLAR|nr:unnamed protein product [Thlaspi arvense]